MILFSSKNKSKFIEKRVNNYFCYQFLMKLTYFSMSFFPFFKTWKMLPKAKGLLNVSAIV